MAMLAVFVFAATAANPSPLPFSLPVTATPTPPTTPPGDLEAVRGVISRVLGPEFVPAFELSVEPTLCDGGAPHGCFALRPGSGATASVQVAGSSVSELVTQRHPAHCFSAVFRPFCAVFPPFLCAVRLPGAETERTGEKWRKMGEIWGRNG